MSSDISKLYSLAIGVPEAFVHNYSKTIKMHNRSANSPSVIEENLWISTCDFIECTNNERRVKINRDSP